MAWLQHTQSSLSEKVSRAEDFHCHTLLRQGFRNWLKVCLHPSGEAIPGEPAAAVLSLHHHSTHLQPQLSWLALSLFQHHPIPFRRGLLQLSTLHHPPQPRTLSYMLFPTTTFMLSPCSQLIFLHYCPCCPLEALSQHCSVCVYWAGGGRKKPFSPPSAFLP